MEIVDAVVRDIPQVVPDVIWKARLPGVGWSAVLRSVVADLNAGTETVCIFDAASATSSIFDSDGPPHVVEHRRGRGVHGRA